MAVSALPAGLLACSCSSFDVCTEASRTDVSFVGRVEEVRFSTKEFLPGGRVEKRHHTFSVSERLRGEIGSTVVVTTSTNSAECGTEFEKGVEYVVFADRFGDGLGSSLCSGSRERPFANSRLRYLRAVAASSPPPSYLFGSVSNFKDDLALIGGLDATWPVANARIRATNGKVIREAVTGPDGSYAFTGLTQGTYRVEVAESGRFDSSRESTVELQDGGCATASFHRADQASLEVCFAPEFQQGAGARVTLEPIGADMSRWGDWRPYPLVAEAKAEIAVFSAPPGRYRIAWRPGGTAAPVMHRGTVELESGARVQVEFSPAEP